MIVLDASAAVDLLLASGPHARRIRERIATAEGQIAAPHLIDVEVAQVLQRFVRAKAVTETRALEALEDLADLPIHRYPHGPLLRRAFALRSNATVYDAVYLVLAGALDAPLVTRDARLARLPLRRVARVEVV